MSRMGWMARHTAMTILIVACAGGCSKHDGAGAPATQTAPLAATPADAPAAPVAPAPAAAVAPAPVETPSAAETATPPARPEPQQHVVTGVVTQWRPMIVFAEPGDQVVFKQMAGHDTQTIDGMMPDGAAAWKSKLGQEGFAVTLEVPGVYIYKCNPHASLGMIGAIALSMTIDGALTTLERMTGFEAEEVDEFVRDCVGEMSNMIGGRGKRDLSRFELKLGLLQVIVGEDYAVYSPRWARHYWLALDTDIGPCTLDVGFDIHRST